MAAQAREFWLPVLKKSNRKSRGILATTVRTCFAICFLLASTASAVVTISPADPELLQHGILDAYAAGQKSVSAPISTVSPGFQPSTSLPKIC